jgi:hypothetical protein
MKETVRYLHRIKADTKKQMFMESLHNSQKQKTEIHPYVCTLIQRHTLRKLDSNVSIKNFDSRIMFIVWQFICY